MPTESLICCIVKFPNAETTVFYTWSAVVLYDRRKNIHDTLIRIAENEAYEEMRRNRKNRGEYIRDIFNMYLNGCSLDQIKDYLESEGVSTKTGKTVWSKSLLKNILSNERYCGDLLMQKTYTENCITKKVKKNRGEMPKYLVKNNHPAIVTQSTFKMVQMEMARRGNVRKKTDSGITEQGKYSGRFALTDLLVCGECGSPYRRKTYSTVS